MTLERLAASLAGSRDAFEMALRHLADFSFVAVITAALSAIDSAHDLNNSERERRIRTLLNRLPAPAQEDYIALAALGASATPSIRNALLHILPPKYRRALFVSSPRSATISAPSKTVSETVAPNGVPVVLETEIQHYGDVLILSLDADPATNRLLERAGLVPLRCTTYGECRNHLDNNTSICAFLVESSFLRANQADQPSMLRDIASYSTFTHIRIDSSGLAITDKDVFELVRSSRCSSRPPSVDVLSIKDGAGIQERELPYVLSARDRLADVSGGGLFSPSEFSKTEFRLLGAAIMRYAEERRYSPQAQLKSARTEIIQGGMSEATVVLIHLNHLQYPVVAKVHDKCVVLEEARRFFTFIAESDRELHPEVHLHGPSGVIIFDAIPGADVTRVEPAPTLASLLSDYWFAEVQRADIVQDDASVVGALSTAADRLVILNSRHYTKMDFSCRANPYVEAIQRMEDDGFDWGFSEDILVGRLEAQNRLRAHGEAAICHGDAHTRNVLVRGNQGYLIDYAYSGPGHPCADLTRLELSIFLTAFHPFGRDARIVALQRDLSTEGQDYETLLANYPDLLPSRTNRLCIRLCVAVRERIRAVINAHELTWEDYKATKLLAAWQALLAPTLQQALVRATIEALSA